MNTTNALARVQSAGMPSPDVWRTMFSMAEAFVASGLMPAHIKTPAAAVAVMQKGMELGVPPMHALSNIVVIQGKPTCNAELMLALIYRDHGDDAIVFANNNDNERCEIAYKRRGWSNHQKHRFTMDDAKRAGLSGSNWSKYPGAMLRARCISAVARMAFPDTIAGMYTAEELGAAVVVDHDGEVTYDARGPLERSRASVASSETAQMFEDQDMAELEAATDRANQASVVDGRVVTDDGEIVGMLHAVDFDEPDEQDGTTLRDEMTRIYTQLCEIEKRSDLAALWPTINAAMQTDTEWFARCTREWERITGKRAPVRTQQELTVK